MDESDIGRLVDETARRIGLPIAPEYRDKVIAYYAQTLAIAEPLLALDLADELTALPVFRP